MRFLRVVVRRFLAIVLILLVFLGAVRVVLTTRFLIVRFFRLGAARFTAPTALLRVFRFFDAVFLVLRFRRGLINSISLVIL